MTLYPIGTIVNCNRCNKIFPLREPRLGTAFDYDQEFPSQAIRLRDFSRCPHCNTIDTHWVYARNNPKTPEVEFEIILLQLKFKTSEQMQFMHKKFASDNIPSKQIGNTLQFETAQDAEAAIRLTVGYMEKRNREPR